VADRCVSALDQQETTMSSKTALTAPRTLILSGYVVPTPYRPSLAAGVETASELLSRAAKHISGALATLWRRYLTWQMRRATRMVLHSLDSRSLNDIGMDRSEIEAFVRDLKYRPARS
jgi:uncharacterized protein YjiS (DUF1127 family)